MKYSFKFKGGKKLRNALKMVKTEPVKAIVVFEDRSYVSGTVISVENKSMTPASTEPFKVKFTYTEIKPEDQDAL